MKTAKEFYETEKTNIKVKIDKGDYLLSGFKKLMCESARKYAEYYHKQKMEEKMPSDEESQMMGERYPKSVYYHNGWNDCFEWLKLLLKEEK